MIGAGGIYPGVGRIPRIFQSPSRPTTFMEGDLWVDETHHRVWVYEAGKLRDLCPYVDVRSWGADPINATNYGAFTAAFTEAAARSDGSWVLVSAGTYDLDQRVDLTGMGAIHTIGHGHALSRIRLVNPSTVHDGFYAASGVANTRWRDIGFDASAQKDAVTATEDDVDVNNYGYAIRIVGDPYPVFEGLSGSFLNRSLINALGATRVECRAIRGDHFAHVDPTVSPSTPRGTGNNAGMGFIYLPECTSILVDGASLVDSQNQRVHLVGLRPRKTGVNRPRAEQAILTNLYGRDIGNHHLVYGGGGLVNAAGSWANDNYPKKVVIAHVVCVRVDDSILWPVAEDVEISDVFADQSGPLELQARRMVVSDVIHTNSTYHGIWAHTDNGYDGGTNGPDMEYCSFVNVHVSGARQRGIFFDNALAKKMGRIDLDNVTVDGARYGGLQFNKLTGSVHAKNTVVANTQQARRATTTLAVIAHAGDTTLTVSTTDSQGDWSYLQQAQQVALEDPTTHVQTDTGRRILEIGTPSGGQVVLTIGTPSGGPTGLPAGGPWPVGTRLSESFMQHAAVEITGDSSGQPGIIYLGDVEVYDDQLGTTQEALRVDGVRQPVRWDPVISIRKAILVSDLGGLGWVKGDSLSIENNGVANNTIEIAPFAVGDGTYIVTLGTALTQEPRANLTVTNTTRSNTATTKGSPAKVQAFNGARIVTEDRARVGPNKVGFAAPIPTDRLALRDLAYMAATASSTTTTGVAVGEKLVRTSDLTGLGWVSGDHVQVGAETATTLALAPSSNGDGTWMITLADATTADHLNGATITNSDRSNSATISGLPIGATKILVADASHFPTSRSLWFGTNNAAGSELVNCSAADVANKRLTVAALTALHPNAETVRLAALPGRLRLDSDSWDGTVGAYLEAFKNTANGAYHVRTQRDNSNAPIEHILLEAATGGKLMLARACAFGSALVSGDFAIAAGWGNTATFTIDSGSTDEAGGITVASAGTGQAANPTVTLTFHDGAWPVIPIVAVAPAGGASTWRVTSRSKTAVTFTFVGTPAAASSYTLYWIAKGGRV